MRQYRPSNREAEISAWYLFMGVSGGDNTHTTHTTLLKYIYQLAHAADLLRAQLGGTYSLVNFMPSVYIV